MGCGGMLVVGGVGCGFLVVGCFFCLFFLFTVESAVYGVGGGVLFCFCHILFLVCAGIAVCAATWQT